MFLFALYHVSTIIVLINMLIAMMSHSFEAIQVCTAFISVCVDCCLSPSLSPSVSVLLLLLGRIAALRRCGLLLQTE